MTPPPSRAAQRWRLAAGTRLLPTSDGLLFVGRLPAKKIDLGDRLFERALAEALEAGVPLDGLAARIGPRSLDRALEALAACGAIVPEVRYSIVDLLSPGAADPADAAVDAGALRVIIADLSDERLGVHLRAARAAGAAVLAVWTSARTIVAAYEGAPGSPCVGCALLFDVSARALSPDGSGVAGVQAPPSDPSLAALACAISRNLVAPGALRPSPGRALVLDAATWRTDWETYPAHPACGCAAAHGSPEVTPSPPSPVDWRSLAGRRLAPLVCVDAGGERRAAKVAYRASARLWPVDTARFGMATAHGPAREVRAVAEGIERFAMLHAPPDRSAVSADALAAPSLDERQIRSLLFRPAERGLAGFRFGDYDRTRPLDWSWANHPRTAERVLVPTSLIGRSPVAASLCDPTSNGYAAHLGRPAAIERALCEVVERDAVLLTWFLQRPVIAIDAPVPLAEPAGVREIIALVATCDIDLPVVWLLARRPDGALRSASAAGATFEDAWARAVLEMDALLAPPPRRHGEPPAIDDPARRCGPVDHLRYYEDPARAARAIEAIQVSDRLTLDALRRRWPGRPAATSSVDAVVDALAAAGLDAWIVDRSLPHVFGAWHVVRALVPGAIELSWGQPYRRLAGDRVRRLLDDGQRLSTLPHPVA